ncbi:SDR family NAD(P)-dependent oxidoreductase [Acidaminobacter sp. JC074]|uniref:SDR family NAD(P)-dependent oxidoreductase n=1 Tax=Acidaminobacter sp. JC074 TaxID=2530199 RepID=UPI001F0E5C93|nr:SDR family NAD(P)-dependent oxidoreductase [Acidaminobacter sp. JC074]MCH4886746.1 SDR family NAD(P)-dependent oxidoreductase [Acidaminobacter sp. JC074]
MRVLITGGTNGMGKGLARALASDKGSHEIIILCRSKERGLSTIEELEVLGHNHKISFVECDLMKLKDVKRAVNKIKATYDYLDAVFINAGVGYAPKRLVSEDGMMAHFQVNYLSQFILTLNVLDLLEESKAGGRIVFNATRTGKINWDDLQLDHKWSYEEGIHQSMVAKRMFLNKLDKIYNQREKKVSFIGFEISKIVWTNQINIIPFYMKVMSRIMKLFGSFISIDTCGSILLPLFIEEWEASLKRSGSFITWKKGQFEKLEEEDFVLDDVNQNRLWDISLDLSKDEVTRQVSQRLHDLDQA